MNKEHISKLQEGTISWNQWRKDNPDVRPSLRDVGFNKYFPSSRNVYNLPYFEKCDFSNCDLHGVELRNGTYISCIFDHSDINWADFVDGYFQSCSFKNVRMRVSKIGSAKFVNCEFENSDLSYCSAEDTDFTGSVFVDTRLEHMSLVKCNFSNTKIDTCSVYGTSTWDLILDGALHENIAITDDESDLITVDNLELAQFLYLLINNRKLRNVLDTITSKVVLILGNFSLKRKVILDFIRSNLRKHNYIPVMFDFEKPNSRNLTETVVTLASMSKFIVADLSSPRSLPHELSALIPRMQSVALFPIIESPEEPYGMFEDFRVYSSVRAIRHYTDANIENIIGEIIAEDRG